MTDKRAKNGMKSIRLPKTNQHLAVQCPAQGQAVQAETFDRNASLNFLKLLYKDPLWFLCSSS